MQPGGKSSSFEVSEGPGEDIAKKYISPVRVTRWSLLGELKYTENGRANNNFFAESIL